jgi:hypothetical protein
VGFTQNNWLKTVFFPSSISKCISTALLTVFFSFYFQVHFYCTSARRTETEGSQLKMSKENNDNISIYIICILYIIIIYKGKDKEVAEGRKVPAEPLWWRCCRAACRRNTHCLPPCPDQVLKIFINLLFTAEPVWWCCCRAACRRNTCCLHRAQSRY